MWFVLIWIAILATDLLVWAVCRRHHWLYLQTYRLSFLRRSLVIESLPRKKGKAGSSSSGDDQHTASHHYLPPEKVPERVQRMLILDKEGNTDLTPSSRVQMAVSLVILLQNSLAVGIVGGENVVQTVCRRAGQLAFVNTIPLVLLAFPDMALGKLARQCSPEITWAHDVFGWLVWLNSIVHVGLSNATAAESVAMIFSFFGIAGILFLYATLLLKATTNSKTSAQRRGCVTTHGILGAGFLVSVLLHVPKGVFLAVASVSITLFVLGCLFRHTPTVPTIGIVHSYRKDTKRRQWGIDCHMDNLKITDGEACYLKVNGEPVRVACTNPSYAGAASSSLILITSQEKACVTGPFFAFHSPCLSAPEYIVVFCSYRSFAEAHSLLHARKGRTYVVWVGPKSWLLRHLMRDHKCLYEHFILKARDSRIKGLGFMRLGTAKKIAQVHSPHMQAQGSLSGVLGDRASYYDQPDAKIVTNDMFDSESQYDSTVTESDDNDVHHVGAQTV